jgi:hypothetical protein
MINNLEEKKSNNYKNNNILSKNQLDNLINFINLSDLLKKIKLKTLNKINKKQYLFQKNLKNEVYNINKKLNFFQIKNHYIKYIYKFNIKDLIILICSISTNSNKKLLKILNLYIKKNLYLNLKKFIFIK